MFDLFKKFSAYFDDNGGDSLKIFQYILRYPTLFVFPFVQIGLYVFVLMAWVTALISLLFMSQTMVQHSYIAFIFLGFCTFPIFILVFINSFIAYALTIYVTNLWNNKQISVLKSFFLSAKNIWFHVQWTFVNSIVQFIINMNIGTLFGKWSQTILWITKHSWATSTFFLLPINTVKKKSFLQTFKDSDTIIENKFPHQSGELINFSFLGSATGKSLFVIGLIPSVIFAYQLTDTQANFWSIIIFGALIIPSILMTTARTIFKTALYRWTQGLPSVDLHSQNI